VELYKQWFTLADFLPNLDISRGFVFIIHVCNTTNSLNLKGKEKQDPE
jgi:hypothetical protein